MPFGCGGGVGGGGCGTSAAFSTAVGDSVLVIKIFGSSNVRAETMVVVVVIDKNTNTNIPIM